MSIDKRQREDHYKPIGVVEKSRQAETAKRKELFDQLNRYIVENRGWTVSIPGQAEVVFEVLPDSQLPWLLIERGWIVTAADPPEGQRILPGSIVEKFVRRADGELEPLTPESTKPVTEVRTHAGIVRTKRYSFALP